jgi:NDP-4-keto-2,6-dideoxyhexose 3-C-methyltransferase
VEVLDLGQQVLTGRFPFPEEPSPPAGPLQLVLCHDREPARCCGLLQLRHSYPLEEMYGDSYGYRSSNNVTMVDHLRRKLEPLLARVSPRPGDLVLDIGSNDGTLLKQYERLGLRRFGVDPSSARFAREYPGDVTLLVSFFSAAGLRPYIGQAQFKIITSIAMFYDLERPLEFMQEVRSLLAPDGVWELEQGYLPDMLEHLAYDAVCHEHLSYYRLRQIAWMAQRAGLKILDVERNQINGGSFSLVVARQEAPYAPQTEKVQAVLAAEEAAGLSELGPYQELRRRTIEHRRQLLDFFHTVKRSRQTVLGYGASTKGNVILQFCGLGPADLPAIAEKYPLKFGRVTPGSRIPIVSEAEARARRPDIFLVLPWYYREEIVERERDFLRNGGTLAFPLPALSWVRESIEVPGLVHA